MKCLCSICIAESQEAAATIRQLEAEVDGLKAELLARNAFCPACVREVAAIKLERDEAVAAHDRQLDRAQRVCGDLARFYQLADGVEIPDKASPQQTVDAIRSHIDAVRRESADRGQTLVTLRRAIAHASESIQLGDRILSGAAKRSI